jgi:hypothetical protein
MPPTRLTALTLAAGAIAIGGCGSTSKSDSSTSNGTQAANALTRAQLIAQADAICASTNAALSASRIKSSSELARILPQAAAYDRAETIQLRKLVPPASMANDWKQILVGVQKFAEATSAVAADAQTNKLAAATRLVAATERTHEQTAAIAKRDGFSDCGEA